MNTKNQSWLEHIQLTPPSLTDNTADCDRLRLSLMRQLQAKDLHLDLALTRQLPTCLRDFDYQARCVVFGNDTSPTLVAVVPPLAETVVAGLAVDLGTTRVVLRLINLENGDYLAETSFENPQTTIGDDILTRLHFAETENGLDQLHRLIIDGINTAIGELCDNSQIDPTDIYLLSVAGNTAMTHLLLNLSPRWMIREPYIPVTNTPGIINCADLGLTANPRAKTFVFPNVGSYFGGDLVAGILFSGLNQSDTTGLLVDVGTNAEVVLGDRNWLIACAGAAGPALEGGVAKIGAKAGPGVIDTIAIDPDTLDITVDTIAHKPPEGICGSALIDLLAGLFRCGLLDIRGKLVPEKKPDAIIEIDGIRHLTIVSKEKSGTGASLSLNQLDIDNIIRSKAAMYSILRTITNTIGIDLTDIATFYVAGTFGSLINPESAITIGMLPDLPLETFSVLGNSSLEGATRLLLKKSCMREIREIQNRITYLELNVNQEFMNRFSAARFLPHTDTSRFPSVKFPGREE